MSRNGIALAVAVLLGVGPTSPSVAAQSAAGGSANAHVQALRSRGWELAYNLDYAEALAALEEAIALESGRAGAAPPRRLRHLDGDTDRLCSDDANRLIRTPYR